MAIYMPPLCRKKRVIERYNPDSFRVISTDAEDTHQKPDFTPSNEPSEWRKQWLDNSGLALPDIYNKRTEVLSHSAPDYRAHKPHPGSCGFLRYNVRFLNEPVCSVYTESTQQEQHDWWPSRTSNEPLQEPPKPKDTIYRADFSAEREDTQVDPGSTRHTANPNKDSAHGIVPVNFLRAKDGKKRFFREKISYEHQYNSRQEPNYPIRSKRHGAFVWNKMSNDKSQKFIDSYKVFSPEEGLRRQQRQEEEKVASRSAHGNLDSLLTEATAFAPPPAEPAPVTHAPVEKSVPEPVSEPQAPVENTVQTGDNKPASQKQSPKTSAKGSRKEVSNVKEPTNIAETSNEKAENVKNCKEPEYLIS